MRDIIFITFDIIKEQYPSMPYPIAVLIAALQSVNIKASHYSIDLQHVVEEKASQTTISEGIHRKIKENLPYFYKFTHIAVSVAAWSIDYSRVLLMALGNYKGKVILGGYEVTAMEENKLSTLFPRADYFIKGFAEKALKKIMCNEFNSGQKILSEKISPDDMVSPYLSGVLPLFSRKIYWETKRGCPYRCGFCEWGNATKEILSIDSKRLSREIELFRNSNIDEINILDGTFTSGKEYTKQIELLLTLFDVKITCQARFENLYSDQGRYFLELCSKNPGRIHLELGLQTIHPNEMKAIGRTNDLEKVETVLLLFREMGIDYEVSIIYAIPGQTVESFIDTIEYLIAKGCKRIMAFPLRIPQNSKMENDKMNHCIIEGKDRFNIQTVIGSYSFPVEQRLDMDSIAARLNSGNLNTDIYGVAKGWKPGPGYTYKKATPYQWNITAIDPEIPEDQQLLSLIIEFLSQTISEMSKKNSWEGMTGLGQSFQYLNNKMKLVSDLLSGEYPLELNKSPIPDFDAWKNPQNWKNEMKLKEPDYESKKYLCKIRMSKSGNIYVYREVV